MIFTPGVIPDEHHPRGKIQAYALSLVFNGAQSAVEDDMDEDGLLSCPRDCDHVGLCADHEAACDLAQQIVDALEQDWRRVLAMVEVPEPDIEAHYAPTADY
jgi:hypothetical protein